MQADFVQTQAKQNFGQAGFRAHLTTEANPDTGLLALLDHPADAAQDSRMKRLVKVGNP